MTSVLRAMGLAVLLPQLLLPKATAQQVDPTAEPAPLARGYRTRTLAGGWGHSWLHGWPGYAQAVSDIQYFGFYPQMGWFVTNWLELYGEGTVHVYYRPHAAILGGVVGIGGRHYFLRDRQWTPYFYERSRCQLRWCASNHRLVSFIERTFTEAAEQTPRPRTGSAQAAGARTITRKVASRAPITDESWRLRVRGADGLPRHFYPCRGGAADTRDLFVKPGSERPFYTTVHR